MIPPLLSNLFSPSEVAQLLAGRMKALRLLAGYKQTTLAQRAGMSVASLKRFESTGQIALASLLRLAHVLDRLPELTELFAPSQATSLAELRGQAQSKNPRRGRV